MLIQKIPDTNIAAIMEVEKAAFIPPIRTTEATIKQRLGLGHTYLAAFDFDGTKPIGTIAFRNARFSPQDYEQFPRTFAKYAEDPNDDRGNAVFVYSLGVIPGYRNGLAAKKLIKAALAEAKHRGLHYAVGDARCPSFNGSKEWPEERFEKNEAIHRAITAHLDGGPFPQNETLYKDPVLGFYLKTFGFKPLWIIPDFWMGDEPCGNFMVIIYSEL